ncbi:chemotaxis protein CheW [Massilia sp. GCM10020059]|uniref:Chemotaxis protein CheW n=1 Tax=Massilia agrisoli TaxID=2892444 RepID=A0ABS8IW71_9BURK|nr:chemotaxis protein CheW [Massilia agrisoli]MCC6072741.1 chemotaxis protein CheW [Massilia agrisoli]
MKVLVFHIGSDRYGLRLGAIARVLPAAGLKLLPLAPAFVAGLLDLHGEPVPVIDLSQLAGAPALQLWFDTRIILLDYRVDGSSRALGLLAEHVAGIETIDMASLSDSGVSGAPFLGRVASSAAGMLQLVEPEGLLTDAVRALLFQPQEAPP